MHNRIFPDLFSVEYQIGEPIDHHNRRLFTFNRVVRIRVPFTKVVFIWNRPSSLLVINPDGTEKTLKIPDPTCRILGLNAIAIMVAWILFRRLAK